MVTTMSQVCTSNGSTLLCGVLHFNQRQIQRHVKHLECRQQMHKGLLDEEVDFTDVIPVRFDRIWLSSASHTIESSESHDEITQFARPTQ